MQPTRRERRRAAVSRDISDSALTLFETRGSAATTVDEIAEMAGISERTFFRYFSRKEDAAVWNQFWNEDRALSIVDDVIAAVQAGAPPVEALRESWARVCADFDADDTERARMLRQARLLRKDDGLAAAGRARSNLILEKAIDRLAEALGSGPESVLPRTAVKVAWTVSQVTFEEWARLNDRDRVVPFSDVARRVIGEVQAIGLALKTTSPTRARR
jgi:AcrR family transcriptional regulator